LIDTMRIEDERALKTFSDPLNMRILNLLDSEGPLTSAGVARRFGDSAPRIHYRMKRMEEAGILEVARTESINGIAAKFYAPSARHYQVMGDIDGILTGRFKDGVARFVEERFQESLRLFLKAFEKASENREEKSPGIVSSCTLMMGELEANAFQEDLCALIARHRPVVDSAELSAGQEIEAPTNNPAADCPEEKRPYHFLTAMIVKED
jgi:DNA-binding Lrp family transcriptional regulator